MGCELILNEKTRIISGNMMPELMASVDKLIDEFMAIVNAMAMDRHLQKGIARSQLPCSMVAILDKEKLSILAQFRRENKFASYFQNNSVALTPQQAANSAQWEFGLDDAFVIQFPKEVLDQNSEQRRKSLESISSEHIDSEFNRFAELLSLIRTRPIFGDTSLTVGARSLLLLLPQDKGKRRNYDSIKRAIEAIGLAVCEAEDIRKGRSSVREMWRSINQAAIIIADLTGFDAGVMYGLGIAHTIGKETILVHPQGSKYLTDIPKTHRICYEDSIAGREKLEGQLIEMLQNMLQPISD
jgi:hypothetical protein